VEFVTVTAGENGHSSSAYENYEGSPLKRTLSEDGHATGARVAYLLSLRASMMP
jgi:hypothetical protein